MNKNTLEEILKEVMTEHGLEDTVVASVTRDVLEKVEAEADLLDSDEEFDEFEPDEEEK